MPAATTPHVRGMTLASVGVLALSFDALLVRLADASEWDVTFWRGWLIAVSMSAVWLAVGRRDRRPGRAALVAGGAASVLYGLMATLFVVSVTYTRVANTVVILASSPFFAALWSWLFLRERVPRRTLAAIAVAAAGVAVVFVGAMRAGNWLGDGLAVVLAMLAGAALTVLRRFPDLDRLAVGAGSGVVAGVLVWPLAEPLSLPAASYGWLAVMGLLQMPLATLLIMTATRYLPAPEVSLFLLIETVLAPIWVWLALGEATPPLTFYGGAVVLGTVAVHSWLALRANGSGRARSADRTARRDAPGRP